MRRQLRLAVGHGIAVLRVGRQKELKAGRVAGGRAKAVAHVAARDPLRVGRHADDGVAHHGCVAENRAQRVGAVICKQIIVARHLRIEQTLAVQHRVAPPGVEPVVGVRRRHGGRVPATVRRPQRRVIPHDARILPRHDNPLAAITQRPHIVGVRVNQAVGERRRTGAGRQRRQCLPLRMRVDLQPVHGGIADQACNLRSLRQRFGQCQIAPHLDHVHQVVRAVVDALRVEPRSQPGLRRACLCRQRSVDRPAPFQRGVGTGAGALHHGRWIELFVKDDEKRGANRRRVEFGAQRLVDLGLAGRRRLHGLCRGRACAQRAQQHAQREQTNTQRSRPAHKRSLWTHCCAVAIKKIHECSPLRMQRAPPNWEHRC